MPALIIIWRLVSPIVIEAIDILRILSISDFRFSHSVREIPTLSNTMVIVFQTVDKVPVFAGTFTMSTVFLV